MDGTKHFDVVEVYEPAFEHIRKWVLLPYKVIYVNKAALPDAKVIRVGWSRSDGMFNLPFEN
jgi:hypothetical protein